MSRRKYDGRLFHTRGPAAVKTLVAVRIVGAWNNASPVDRWSQKATATVSDKVDIMTMVQVVCWRRGCIACVCPIAHLVQLIKPWSNRGFSLPLLKHGLTIVDEPRLNHSLITMVYCGLTVVRSSFNHGNCTVVSLPLYSCGNDVVVLWLFIPWYSSRRE